jgi:transposase
MEEFIAISISEYECLKRENAEFRVKIVALEDEVLRLRAIIQERDESLVLLKGGKSSRTSSTAPSSDIARSNTISLRKPSGKKSGGQKGHAGHSLELFDNPTETIEYVPQVCSHCGESLVDVASFSCTRHQVVDIPPPPQLIVTEHRSCTKVCPCCNHKNQGVLPDNVNAPIQYGPIIAATVGYSSVYQYMSYARIAHQLKVLYKLNISQGSIDNILKDLSNKATAVYEKLREDIQSSEVVGADETGCRVNGKKYWFHVWQNPLITFIVSYASRGHKVIEEYFDGDFSKSYYVSDCWSSQLKVKAVHQLCMAHLLREVTNFI